MVKIWSGIKVLTIVADIDIYLEKITLIKLIKKEHSARACAHIRGLACARARARDNRARVLDKEL